MTRKREISGEKKIDAVDDKYFINSFGRSQRVLSKKKTVNLTCTGATPKMELLFWSYT